MSRFILDKVYSQTSELATSIGIAEVMGRLGQGCLVRVHLLMSRFILDKVYTQTSELATSIGIPEDMGRSGQGCLVRVHLLMSRFIDDWAIRTFFFPIHCAWDGPGSL